MMKKSAITLLFSSVFFFNTYAQKGYWQQWVDYQMEIEVDVEKNQFEGDQVLKYTNNSGDTLKRVFYHLYLNAFQPNSMMDIRSRTIEDPDRRVADRILHLKEDEQGWHKIKKLTQDGKKVNYKIKGTLMEVILNQPILPNTSTTFIMSFKSQLPLQVRRTGRDSQEGIRLSMTQWYPKMAEYDKNGWHAYEYIGREFHSVWGNFDVKINIDKDYMLGATGILQNPEEIGKGYTDKEVTPKVKNGKLNWHFKADSVLDFAWAADPDYVHKTASLENGTILHFLYQEDSTTVHWDSLPKYAVRIFEIMNENFGEYPYKQYTIAQGGDGGMEYPMITLITGNRSKGSLVGVTVHEVNHSWYQHLLATNEYLYPWMDEGFTTYTSDFVMGHLFSTFKPYSRYNDGYFRLVKSGKQEPLTTHADHYETNFAYGVASYTMGAMFLRQLGYIVGEEVMHNSLKKYFEVWQYKHPDPIDFIKVVENVSGIELKWFLKYWTESTKTIDYGIESVKNKNGKAEVLIARIGDFPMPIDLLIEYKDGSKEMINIPLSLMWGEKTAEKGVENYKVAADWPWSFPKYSLMLDKPMSEIKYMEIDPSERMPDVERNNNTYPFNEEDIYSPE